MSDNNKALEKKMIGKWQKDTGSKTEIIRAKIVVIIITVILDYGTKNKNIMSPF